MHDTALREGRVPVALLWGPDVRDAWSRWLDSEESKSVLCAQVPDFPGFNDHRLLEFCGLPVYPMSAEGVALRTVAEQCMWGETAPQVESGFD